MQFVSVQTTGWIRHDVDTEVVDVDLGYDPADPFAVRVGIQRDDAVLTWVFARDLLADGLRSMVPLGEGDVQVQSTSVLTEITGPDDLGGSLVLRIPWWNSREFVRMCQAQVPRGQELCDVDAWVAALTESLGEPDAA